MKRPSVSFSGFGESGVKTRQLKLKPFFLSTFKQWPHCYSWQGRVSSWNVYISGVFVVSLMSSLMRQGAFFPPVKIMWEVFQNHNLTSGAWARSWQCWETSAAFFWNASCWTGSLRCQICLRPWSQNEFTEITEIYDDDDDMMEYV